MVFVQGIVMALNAFRRGVESRDRARSKIALTTATDLMSGSEAALRFAGDFSYTDYEQSVRPTLMPPLAPPGMSGLRWRDHEHLIALLAQLRPIFADIEPSLAGARDAFYDAIGDAYSAHRFVCASFVGTERGSLLTGGKTKSAVEMIDHFKRVRMSLVKPAHSGESRVDGEDEKS